MSNNDKQQFEVYAVPYRRPFVVSRDKVEDFKNQKPNPETRKQIEELAERFKVNNLVEGPVLQRKVKFR